MTSTDSVELKCSINTELPWKMVAKGSRSSTRRNKKSVVRAAAADIEAEEKSSPGSEPEKLGVSVLGQHFAERVEHVPIKKRRFIVRSPSPSNRSPARLEGSEQMNHALPVSRLNPNLIDGKTTEKPDCSGHDFYGIEILAHVACSSDMSNDIAAPAVESLRAEESVVQQQDASTLSTHVEGNDSSAGTADVSQKYTPQKSSPAETLCNDLGDEQKEEHSRGTIPAKKTSIALSDESSTERPKANMEAGESENHLAPESGGARKECLKDVRLHWDLNVSMDAWGHPCDAEDGRNVEGEITESVAPKESEPVVDESKDHMDGVIASDGSGPKGNGKDCQSGYDSQFEDGELREPYPWEENEGDAGEVEQVDYGSEPEDERFYSMVDSSDNIDKETNFGADRCEGGGDAPRMVEGNEGSDIEKHVVVCMNDSHLKKGSSPSFVSKPFKELTSHDAIQRRRCDNYEELSAGPDKFVGRDDRSGMRMRNRSPGRGYFSGWDSKRRFSPPNYKGGSYGFGRPRPKSMVDDRGGMINGFDQPGPGPNGHVRRQFSNGGYRGRFRRFPDGGDRDFRGDTNQFPGRMHNRMRRERDNSPVFRRLHYPPQSQSRSRSRSPVSWNGRNRSSPPPPGGFRADERMMERVRLPFQKRFPGDQDMGFRNRMSSPRFFDGRNSDAVENHNNSFRERKFRPGQRFDVGNSMRRLNPDNNNQFRPFIRHRRFDGPEENTGGGNRFDVAQQRTRRSEPTDDGSDDIRRFRFNGDQSLVVANNTTKESCHDNK